MKERLVVRFGDDGEPTGRPVVRPTRKGEPTGAPVISTATGEREAVIVPPELRAEWEREREADTNERKARRLHLLRSLGKR